MRVWLRGALLAGVAPVLTGCEDVEAEWIKRRYPHSAAVVALCTEKNSRAAGHLRMSAEEVRTMCARKHSVSVALPAGNRSRGMPFCVNATPQSQETTKHFEVLLINNSNYILTRVSVGISTTFETPANRRTYPGQVDISDVETETVDVWVMPGAQSKVLLPFMTGEPVRCADYPVVAGAKQTWDWSIIVAHGIKAEPL